MARPRSNKNAFLPPHVYRFESERGAARLRFVKSGSKGGYFSAAFGTSAFWDEYASFMDPAAAKSKAETHRFPPGTLDDLLSRYYQVPERLGPSLVTQAKVRAVLEDFREGRGGRKVSDVTFDHIDRIIAKKKVKTGTGNQTKGGIHAARKLRKELVRLFDFALKLGMVKKNPARMSEQIRVSVAERTTGFHSWTEAEIRQYQDHWSIGTRQRAALELFLWTDQRRSDVHTMGWAQVRGGRIPVKQQKTGKTLWIALAPPLVEALRALPADQTSLFCFIVSAKGTAYTKESFGNWFKDACIAAGLPHCNGHGLRKATLRRMAELGLTNIAMKGVSGQERDETLAIYTRAANQITISDQAITTLATAFPEPRDQDETGDYRFVAEG
jgi:integrase